MLGQMTSRLQIKWSQVAYQGRLTGQVISVTVMREDSDFNFNFQASTYFVDYLRKSARSLRS